MTGTALLILCGLVGLAIGCLATTAVHSLRDFSRAQLRDLLEARNQPQRFDEIIEHHQRAALGAESLRVIAAAAAVLAGAAWIWGSHAAEISWPQSLALTIGQLVAGAIVLWMALIWLPTAIARVWAEAFLVRTWSLWRATGNILAPSLIGADLIGRVFNRLAGKSQRVLTEEELEEEIREVVTEGQREGLIEEDAREMIESVIALGEVQVSEIMTPRTDMISIPADLPWDEALRVVISSGHTRIPVSGKSRDEVIGILHIKDMLQELARGPDAQRRPLSDLLRAPFFVPATKPVDDLLQEFQRSRNHIAVVLDEYGGVAGLVTIEDVLEEIVGEIADEHDDVAADGIKVVSERTCEALARVHISEINERMGLHLSEDEHFDTIGGFVFHELGRIPHAGEELLHDGVKIRVLEATRRRINRVAIEVLPPPDPQGTEAGVEMGVPGAE